MVVGDVGEADSDWFGDSVQLHVGDPVHAQRDLVAPGATVPGLSAEHKKHLRLFGHPQSTAR